MTRIILVDEHEIARRGMRVLLAERPRLEVIAEARNVQQAIDAAQQQSPPDLIIIGYDLREMYGGEVIAQLRNTLPSTEILIFSRHNTERVIVDLINAGARGIVLKADPAKHVLAAIESLRTHRPYFSPAVSDVLLAARGRKNSKAQTSGITSRERQVVQLIAEGMINKQVAHALSLSIKTVESHRSAVMMKMNLRNTADLVRYAVRNELVAA
jgi:DNA-binding NarL/FixJ family response regulator